FSCVFSGFIVPAMSNEIGFQLNVADVHGVWALSRVWPVGSHFPQSFRRPGSDHFVRGGPARG
ncbi:MAG: hypothetical protein ABIV50_11280, partial [Opitutus sp.]